jgi:hypothetical protein
MAVPYLKSDFACHLTSSNSVGLLQKYGKCGRLLRPRKMPSVLMVGPLYGILTRSAKSKKEQMSVCADM